jgi:hypothetical protein
MIHENSKENIMAATINKNDTKLLEIIAEHRLLTVEQATWIAQKPKRCVYRRVQRLITEGFLSQANKDIGQDFGRPKTLIELTESGAGLLIDKGLLNPTISYENVTAANIHCPGHQMLMNWFRICFKYAEKVIPAMRTRFLSHTSPFLPRDPAGRAIIADKAPALENGSSPDIRFIPDGALSITDTTRGLTVLLFLEVDCGTETLASPKRDMTDIRQKIINYQSYFLSERYKRYEKLWNCKLRGFHLLFLTNTEGRLRSLCRLAQEMGPEETSFIYLTEQGRLFNKGVTAEIWAQGGNLTSPQESLFGCYCCPGMLPRQA